jgi:hypothetical protein
LAVASSPSSSSPVSASCLQGSLNIKSDNQMEPISISQCRYIVQAHTQRIMTARAQSVQDASANTQHTASSALACCCPWRCHPTPRGCWQGYGRHLNSNQVNS